MAPPSAAATKPEPRTRLCLAGRIAAVGGGGAGIATLLACAVHRAATAWGLQCHGIFGLLADVSLAALVAFWASYFTWEVVRRMLQPLDVLQEGFAALQAGQRRLDPPLRGAPDFVWLGFRLRRLQQRQLRTPAGGASRSAAPPASRPQGPASQVDLKV